MGLINYIRRMFRTTKNDTSADQTSSHQREEGADEVLIFVVDESYDRTDEYVDMDKYTEEVDWTEAASRIFLKQIEGEFQSDFEEVNVGPGADLPAFVTAITSNIIPLIPWLMAVFFSGKPIVDNMAAWRTIYEKIRPYFSRITLLNRNGAAVLVMEAVFEDMDGLPKSVVLRGYKSEFRNGENDEISPPQAIEGAPPTLNLSMDKHVFDIKADGVEFIVIVDGTKVEIRRT